MASFRLSRRAVLKGTAGIAIALPWLEAMSPSRRARAAAATPARRFLAVYTPGGTVLSQYRPTGTETAFTLSPILSPLAPLQDRIIVADGLDMPSAVGEQSQSGMIAWLTGNRQHLIADPSAEFTFAVGPSLDQVLAARPEALVKRFPSLQMAVRWGSGRARGAVSPSNITTFDARPGFLPIAPRIDPAAIWQELFGAAVPARPPWARSMLDFVDRRYAALSQRLGAADKQRLDAHLTNLRTLETSLPAVPSCGPVPLADITGYDPHSGLDLPGGGGVDSLTRDPVTDAAIPKVGKFMMDLMVMALACDLTGVATLQWCDTEASYSLPWLNLPNTHIFYQHEGGYHPPECQAIHTWYVTQHAYLLQQMANVDMGGHSLLDESVVFFGSEIQEPPTRLKTNMPFLLAGNGGGLRTGRFMNFGNRSHNDLLVSLLNLFGDARTTFGDPAHCDGPLPL